MKAVAPAAIVLAVGVACAQTGPTPAPTEAQNQQPATIYGFVLVNSYPHDPAAFTQGLIFRDGFLYESTGLNGRSSLRKVRLETGEVLQRQDVDRRYFAEGLTDWNGRLLQLTWETNVGFIYDLTSFAPQGTFKYTGEGWGLATDRDRLIMSDGTATLRFLDPNTLQTTGTVMVRDSGQPVTLLNELEVIGSDVFANVYTTDRIVRIDPETGAVTGHLDLDRLHAQIPPDREIDVLNGIAWDAQGKRLFVTGKLWPTMYQLKVQGVN